MRYPEWRAAPGRWRVSFVGVCLLAALILYGSESPISVAPSAASGTARSSDLAMPARLGHAGLKPGAPPRLVEAYGKLPLAFEANQGQADPAVNFLARGKGYALFLTGEEVVLSLTSASRESKVESRKPKTENRNSKLETRNWKIVTSGIQNPKSKIRNRQPRSSRSRRAGSPTPLFGIPQSGIDNHPAPSPQPLTPSVVRLRLVGANPNAKVTGLDALPGKSNYFIGNDPAKWRTHVPHYAKVRYRDVWPGIDVVFYGKSSAGRRQEAGARSQGSRVPSPESGGTEGATIADHAQLEFDFVVAPGVDPGAIRFAVETGNSKIGNRASRIRNPKSKIENPPSSTPLFGVPQSGIDNHQLAIDGDGDLVIATAAGEVRFRKPVVYQERSTVESRESKATHNGRRTTDNPQSSIIHRQWVDGRYVLRAAEDGNSKFENRKSGGENPKSKIQNPKWEVAFELAAYDPRLPLVIDPVLTYSTYLGGADSDFGYDVALDSAGNAFLAGIAISADFPTTNSAYAPTCDLVSQGYCLDAFVSKFNPAGDTLLYSTYFGGTGLEVATSLALDGAGNAYTTGFTWSLDMPTTAGAFQRACNPPTSDECDDVFAMKLNPTGSTLLYSTYLGGSGIEDSAWGIALDDLNNAYLTGQTDSLNFPVTATPYQPACRVDGAGACYDAYLTVLNPTATSLVYSTYLGGSGEDAGGKIALDDAGNAYITGYTVSADLPATAGAYDSTCGTTTTADCNFDGTYVYADAFVAKLNATLAGPAGLRYLTYLGGSSDDAAFPIFVSPAGLAYVAGQTYSTDFPTTPGVIQPACNLSSLGDCEDAFVAQLNAEGSALRFSTYLGGSEYEALWGIAVDLFENVLVVGETESTDFPFSASALQPACAVDETGYCWDAFLVRLDPAGEALTFSTYLGGTGIDYGVALAVDGLGNPVLMGGTDSTDFPVNSPFQPSNAGWEDLFVARIDFVPAISLSPASLTFDPQLVNTPSQAKNITVSNTGEGALAILSIPPPTGDFSRTHTCNTPLPPGGSCTVGVTFLPTATGARSGQLTITHNAPGGERSIQLSGIGTDFSLAAASGSSTSATVNAGQTATYSLNINPDGFSGSVSLSCTENITAATCSVSPTSVALDGVNPASVSVNVTTTARSWALPRLPSAPPAAGDWARHAIPTLLALLLASLAVRARRRARWALGVVILLIAFWTACGGGGGGGGGTPAGTYTVAVTATVGTINRTINLTLTVR